MQGLDRRGWHIRRSSSIVFGVMIHQNDVILCISRDTLSRQIGDLMSAGT